MFMTKITINSVDKSFLTWSDFGTFLVERLGENAFTELSYKFSDKITAGVMLPYEKTELGNEGKTFTIKRYHNTSENSREFQLYLLDSSEFRAAESILLENNITITMATEPSDEITFEALQGNSDFIDVDDPYTFVRGLPPPTGV